MDNDLGSSPLLALPMTTKAIACSLILIAGIVILASTVFMFPSLMPNQPSAFATFPGENGKIAFTSTREGKEEIYVMNAEDGSGLFRNLQK
jgi:hypothetical protein